MAEELGTRDVLEQVDTRLGNVERDVRALGTELRAAIDALRSELNGWARWIIGLILASWLSVMASIWLAKP